LIVLAVLAVALGFAFRDRVDRPVYLTAQVERGKMVKLVTATGTANAVVTVEVGSQLSGQVAELLVDFNDAVRRGQAIARLDDRTFKARVAQARAAVEVAEANVLVQEANWEGAKSGFAGAEAETAVLQAATASARALFREAESDHKRKEALKAKGTVTESDFDRARAKRDAAAADLRGAEAKEAVHEQTIALARADLQRAEAEYLNAQANLAQARALLEQAEIELERTVIRSPIDGVVIGRDVDTGQTVAASLEAPTIFTIAQDLHEMEVHARIDEADIGTIAVDQRVVFTVDAYPGREFDGRVIQMRKAPEVVQNVVTYTVVIATANPDLDLLPGMTALVRVVVTESDEVLKLPNAALRFRPPDGTARASVIRSLDPGAGEAGETTATVWVLEDGVPAPVEVRVGMSDGSASELTAGPLAEGQDVIVGLGATPENGGLFGLRFGF